MRKEQPFRYLYVKHSDVTEELKTFEAMRGNLPDGGPLGYFSSFLDLVGNAPVLILSAHSTTNKQLKLHNIEARCFPDRIRLFGLFEKPAALLYMFTISLVKVIWYKPNRIICARKGVLLWMCYLIARLYDAVFVYFQVAVQGKPVLFFVDTDMKFLKRNLLANREFFSFRPFNHNIFILQLFQLQEDIQAVLRIIK